MMVYILVHRGPIPSFLHPQLYIAICHGLDKAEVTIDNIRDIDIQMKSKWMLKNWFLLAMLAPYSQLNSYAVFTLYREHSVSGFSQLS